MNSYSGESVLDSSDSHSSSESSEEIKDCELLPILIEDTFESYETSESSSSSSSCSSDSETHDPHIKENSWTTLFFQLEEKFSSDSKVHSEPEPMETCIDLNCFTNDISLEETSI